MLVSPAEVVAKAKATIKECSIRDAQNCLNVTTLLVDIREAKEFAQGHLPGAIHISRGLLEFEILPAIGKRGDITDAEDCPTISTSTVFCLSQPLTVYSVPSVRVALAESSVEPQPDPLVCLTRSMVSVPLARFQTPDLIQPRR